MNPASAVHIHLVSAARPNFMKIAPLYHRLKEKKWAYPQIVHTGQHYDFAMSAAFFENLGLPEPSFNLEIGSGSHAEQTGKVMIAYEKVIMERRPDLVVVAGDVNSTMAAAITSVKLGIKTAHLEAGLRSFDRSMPEEINRLITDTICDMLWTPSKDGDDNLRNEGIPSEKITRVGNIMIDSFEMLRSRIEAENILKDYNLRNGEYAVLTLHRPGNVDHPTKLKEIVGRLISISNAITIVFPVHPRTRRKLEENGLWIKLQREQNIKLTMPLNYICFMKLVMHSRLVITDSGGIQEETTYLGIPCLTLRPNTERPITIIEGTNKLCDSETIGKAVKEVLDGREGNCSKPELWDGKTSNRIVALIETLYGFI